MTDRGHKIRGDRLSVGRERVILVGGYRKGDLLPGEEPLEELARLAETAGALVVGRLVQNIREINQAFYIGKGKAEELKHLAKELDARCLLFDHDLTLAQGRNLDRLTEVKVMDRTELILDIFAARARTRAAKLQIGLAQAEYRLPRLKRLWTHLERQTGGIGLRGGPGERQLEVDRRKVLERIRDLKADLKTVAARKERAVRARAADNFTVSLVGYTNAGKSTLLRALTGRKAFIEDRLFATVDTQTAALPLGGGLTVPLSDSVGFIRRLPHNLVAGFHATLTEAAASDLLLHIVDASSPLAAGQIESVREVLKKIGCEDRDTLLVFNKCDALKPEYELELRLLCRDFPGAIHVSARKKEGLDELRAEIRRRAQAHATPTTVAVHAGDGRTHAYLSTHFFTERRRRNGEWITYEGHAHAAVLDHLAGVGNTVRILEPALTDDGKF